MALKDLLHSHILNTREQLTDDFLEYASIIDQEKKVLTEEELERFVSIIQRNFSKLI